MILKPADIWNTDNVPIKTLEYQEWELVGKISVLACVSDFMQKSLGRSHKEDKFQAEGPLF